MACILIATFAIVLVAGFAALWQDHSQAAAGDEIYIIDPSGNHVENTTIAMTDGVMQLRMDTSGTMYNDPDKYVISWKIYANDSESAATEIASIEEIGTANNAVAMITAKSPGTVTVTVTVTQVDSGAQLAIATCNVSVMFGIDTSRNDDIYKYVNEGDTTKSLVIYSDHQGAIQLNPNFGDSNKTQWLSNNTEVVKVEKNTGSLTPVGSGFTTVTATYTVDTSGGLETYMATLNVYVVPRVRQASGSYQTTLNAVMPSGECLYTDTDFSNNMEVIRGKIYWVVKKDDGRGNSVIIADSEDKTSDLISITPTSSRTNELRVTGMAGEYDIYFYVKGAYFDETRRDPPYAPTVVHLTLMSSIGDKKEILSIGDNYNFAEAYGMTTEDFLRAFNVSVTLSNGDSIDNYATYDNGTGILRTSAETTLKALITVKDGQENYVKQLMGLDQDDSNFSKSYTTTIDVVDRIYLDRSSITLSLNQTYQLNVVLTSVYDGTVVWSSSDPASVSVDQSGLIKGNRVTTQDVTITATMNVGEGVYKTATCLVKVEAAVDSFTLNPNSKQTMLAGEHVTIVANIRQTVSVAPLDWISSDTKVFTVEPAADGKSAVVTAVSGGEAVLTVYNTVNRKYQTINIEVRVAIQQISFSSQTLTLNQYKEGYNIRNDVKYTPNNATDTAMTWTSSDSKVATVDADGYVKFAGPGTTLITVYPTYNPYNTMASCQLTVVGSPESFSISKTELIMDVGSTQTVEVAFTPSNTTTDLKWTPIESGIVDVSYDGEKKIATLTGRKVGSTNINITSTEGMIANMKVQVRQPAEGLALSPSELIIRTGSTEDITAAFTPVDSTDYITWSTMDARIATVTTDTGRVTGVSAGETVIQAQVFHDKNIVASGLVKVTVRDGLKSISLAQTQETVEVGSSVTLKPTFEPATAYDKTVVWSTPDTSLVSITLDENSNPIITGLAAGTAIITGRPNDSQDNPGILTCVVTVKEKPVEEPVDTEKTVVTVTPKKKYLQKGKTFKVKATVTGASKKGVTWKSTRKSVATVTSKGKVKAKKLGTTYIRATAKDGSGAHASCKVQVVNKVKKIKLNKYTASLMVGKTMKLKAKITPKKATIKKVTWTSDNTQVGTVSASGRVLGVSAGIVKITATSTDGSNKSATCIITVTEPVEATGVSVSNNEITVAKGKSVQSGIAAEPANTTSSIRYYSDNKKVATVDKRGKIHTKRAGEATIYGETSNGMVGHCDVLVVDLNRKAIVLRQYDTEQLHVNEIDTGVTWYSRDINIATVSAGGLVTGRKKGVTTIYAVVNGVKLGCRVQVKKIS